MRDPDRISGIISRLEKVWQENPDLRLGQLIANASAIYHNKGEKDRFCIGVDDMKSVLPDSAITKIVEGGCMASFDPFYIEDEELMEEMERIKNPSQSDEDQP